MYFYRIVKSYNIITTRRLLAYLTLFLSSKAMQQTRPHSRKGNNCLCKIWRHGGFRSNNDDDGRKIPHNLTNNHIICANLDCCCCKNVAAASMLTTLSFGIHAAKKPQRHPLFRHHVLYHRKAGFYWSAITNHNDNFALCTVCHIPQEKKMIDFVCQIVHCVTYS